MTTIVEYFKYAALATASYVRLGGGPYDGQEAAGRANAQQRLPSALGNRLFVQSATNSDVWNVRYYYGSDVPASVDSVAAAERSGFEATLFERSGAGGEKVLALRGTEPTADALLPSLGGVLPVGVDLLSADLGQIGILGLALTQVVSMANLITRLRAPLGTFVPQVTVRASVFQPSMSNYVVAAGVQGSTVYLSFEGALAQGLGVLGPSDTVTVTGHSLGGHLAVMAARLFPGVVLPDVYVFDTAGYDPDSAAVLQRFDGLNLAGTSFAAIKTYLAYELGAGALGLAVAANQLTNPSLHAILNVLRPGTEEIQGSPQVVSVANEDILPGDDINIVSSSFTGADRYQTVNVPTEANSHAMEVLMDSLALHDVLYRLNPVLYETDAALNMPVAQRLLQVASNELAMSEERITEALHAFFVPQPAGAARLKLKTSDATGFVTGNVAAGKGALEARQAFHQAVLEVKERIAALPATALPVTLASLADMSTSELTTRVQASNGLAYRYALKELNPFAILGPDALYNAPLANGAAAHNANGELELFVSREVTPTGMTEAYIADRVAFLSAKNTAYTADAGSVSIPSQADNWYYSDAALGHQVVAFGQASGAIVRRAVFGGRDADALNGGVWSDRLYAAAGSDLLAGGRGDDYLEGGAGMDVYQYNATKALLGALTNDGVDEIRDTDGRGILRYTYTETNLGPNTVTNRPIAGVGLRSGAAEWQSPDGKFTYAQHFDGALAVTINGDAGGTIRVLDFDFAKAQSEGYFGIRLLDAPQAPTIDGQDWSGVVANDFKDTGADALAQGIPVDVKNDRLAGGGGGDVVLSRGGNDVLGGGAERDWLFAGEGADRLYADDAPATGQEDAAMAALIAQATLPGSDLGGELMDGGAGDDTLWGSEYSDVILGGGGKDTLIGGAGNDYLAAARGVATLPTKPGPGAGETVIDDEAVRNLSFGWSLAEAGETSAIIAIGSLDLGFATDLTQGAVIYAGAGNDTTQGADGADYIELGEGDNVAVGFAGDDVIVAGSGIDKVFAGAGDDVLELGGGNDVAYASDGADIVFGGAGADTIYAGAGADILVGGTGNDTLIGGAGKDTYVFNRGDGADTITDTDSGAEASVLVLGEGVSRNDIKFKRGSLVVDMGQGDAMHFALPGGQDDPSQLQILDRIEFADGQVMTWEDILAQGFEIEGTAQGEFIIGTAARDTILGFGGDDFILASTGNDAVDAGDDNDYVDASDGDDEIEGGAGNDTIYAGGGADLALGGVGDDYIDAGDGDDVINGGTGTDTLAGGLGNDTYVYARGDGADTVNDNAGASLLDIATIEAAHLTFTPNHRDGQLYLDVGFADGGADAIAVAGGVTSDDISEALSFRVVDPNDAQATLTLSAADALAQGIAPTRNVTGTGGADLIDGGFSNDTLDGGEGADTLYAYSGNDTIDAGFGDDTIYAGAGDDHIVAGEGQDRVEAGGGNDLIVGGIGNNRLAGGAGDDSYAMDVGGVQDITDNTAPGYETLYLPDGMELADFQALRYGNDLLLRAFDAPPVDPGRPEAGVSSDTAAIVRDFFAAPAGKTWVLAGDVDAPVFLADWAEARLGGADQAARMESARQGFNVALKADVLARGQAGESVMSLYRTVANPYLDYRFDGVATVALSTPTDGSALRTPVPEAESSTFHEVSVTRSISTPVYQTTVIPGSSWIVPATVNGVPITGVPIPGGGSAALVNGGLDYEIQSPARARTSVAGFVTVQRSFPEFTQEVHRSVTTADISGTDGADLVRVFDEEVVEGGVNRLNTLPFRGTVSTGAGDDTILLDNPDLTYLDWNEGDTQLNVAPGQTHAMGAFIDAGAGNDTVVGSNANDQIWLGEGDDIADGGGGADTYHAALSGQGVDTIFDRGVPDTIDSGYGGRAPLDVLVFDQGITLANLRYTHTESSAYDGNPMIDISWGTGSRVRVVYNDTPSQYDHTDPARVGVDLFRLGDGTQLTRAQFLASVTQGPPPNAAPFLAGPIGERAATEGAVFSFQVPADAFIDPDAGDLLAYAAESAAGGALPAWLAFDAASRTLSGTPGAADVGFVDVALTATDLAGESATDLFRITVADAGNDAPVVALAPAERFVTAGEAFAFALPAGTFTDPDAGDTLSFGATAYGGAPLPAWLAFDAQALAFSGTAPVAGIGTWPLTLTATDAAGESASASFNLAVQSTSGATVTGNAGDNVLYGNAGNETLIGRAGNDAIFGLAGDDLLRGGGGNDVLQGGAGNDVLRAGAGVNLLDGGAGDDLIYGGQGAGLIAGGAGNDVIRTGRGSDVIAFNRGDGQDTVFSDREGNNTLSLGGGITYDDLRFARSGNDLVLQTGGSDSITFRNWYRGQGRTSLLNLQIVTEAMAGFDDASSNPLLGNRVNNFSFGALVDAFDAARAADAALTSWALSAALAQSHLGGADDAAIGGDLAYWYGRNGAFTGIGIAAAQAALGNANFGAEAHSLHPFAGLQEGFVKLA